MSDKQQPADLEVLARIAARLAGRDPDEYVRCELAGVVSFEGQLWRYPDFLSRAEAAYEALNSDNLRPMVSCSPEKID